jgi:PAS domain S-box-containing protein
MNSAFVAMLDGDASEDIKSRPVEEFYQDPTTRQRLLETLEDQGQAYNHELEITTLAGNTIWVVVTARVVDIDDTQYIDAFVQDITDRRHREQVLREMHDIISERDREFDDQVSALLELGRTELGTKYGTLSEIRGEDYVFQVVAADDDSIQAGDEAPLSATNCEIAATQQETLVLGDVARDAPAETDRAGYTEWGIACYLGAPVVVDDEVYGTFCFYGTEPRSDQFSTWEVTLVDLMSRWVSAELERKLAHTRLEETNKQLEEFASIVSHDLQSPLNVARGRVDLLAEDCSSEHLDHVRNALDRMEALIDDLLELSLQGKQVATFEPVDLADRCDSWWDRIDTRTATLEVDVDRRLRADPDRLHQVIENLVCNAIDHGGEGVTITIGELDDGFYVADDGPGIPPDARDEVFEAGYSTAADGSGFGLRIVREIVDAHGWNIVVTESSAGGTRFEITGVEFESD